MGSLYLSIRLFCFLFLHFLMVVVCACSYLLTHDYHFDSDEWHISDSFLSHVGDLVKLVKPLVSGEGFAFRGEVELSTLKLPTLSRSRSFPLIVRVVCLSVCSNPERLLLSPVAWIL